MVVKLKMTAKKQDGEQILSCIITALNLYRLMHYKQSSKIFFNFERYFCAVFYIK